MISPATTAVVIIAKAPRPGAVKTRLCPPLTPREALACLLASGHRAAIAIGTDTPTLPTIALQHAVDLIASAGVDVDTPDDLSRLRTALTESPHLAPATSRFLTREAACRLRRETSRS